MIRQSYILHALSPLHPGTGQGVDIVDLPIARMRATGIPIAPASGVKGALRETVEPAHDAPPGDARTAAVKKARAVFGPSLDEGDNPSDHAGAVVIGDARVLVLPVRSLRGVFAWVSSPLLLILATRDLMFDGVKPPAIPQLSELAAKVPEVSKSALTLGKHIYLEDLDLTCTQDADTAAWAKHISERVFFSPSEVEVFEERFVVVDNETMAFLWETATQVDARNRIDNKTGTVVEGALWYEESLPPETLLIGSVGAEASRYDKQRLSATDVLDTAMQHDSVIQFGGKATVGRGICRVLRPAVAAAEGGNA